MCPRVTYRGIEHIVMQRIVVHKVQHSPDCPSNITFNGCDVRVRSMQSTEIRAHTVSEQLDVRPQVFHSRMCLVEGLPFLCHTASEYARSNVMQSTEDEATVSTVNKVVLVAFLFIFETLMTWFSIGIAIQCAGPRHHDKDSP